MRARSKQRKAVRLRAQRKRRVATLAFIVATATATALLLAIVFLSGKFAPSQANQSQPNRISTTATPAQTEQAWPSGIIQSGQVPFPGDVYNITNQWQEVVNGKHLSVYAGSEGQNASQGLLLVTTLSLELHTSTGPGVYLAPSPIGALRITAANGQHLTLTSSTSQRFTPEIA